MTAITPKSGTHHRVGVVVIGDEVLSRKVVDANTPAILQVMAEHGIDVGEVAMIPDVFERISAVVRDFATRFDFVVTTGGVGPTHDDITWEAVADALGTTIALHPTVWQRMQERMPTGVTDEQKRMAMLPVDVQIAAEDGAYLFWCQNVFVMPGIPAMVHRAIVPIARRYQSQRRTLATVYFSRDEWDSVAEVDRIVGQFAALSVGSYPVLDKTQDHAHRVTLESVDEAQVQLAVTTLIAAIGAQYHVRTTWAGGTKGTSESEK